MDVNKYYNGQFDNLETDYSDLYSKPQTPAQNGMGVNSKFDNNLNTSFFTQPNESEINYDPYDAVKAGTSMHNTAGKVAGSLAGKTPATKATGAGIANAAGSVISFGSEVYSASQSMAESDKAADNRTLKLAASGAAMGATVGSVVPVIGTAIGAAAGFVIGGTAGLLMKSPDRKKRLKKSNDEYQGRIFDEINDRKSVADDFQKSQEIERLMDLKKSQMGLVSFKY